MTYRVDGRGGVAWYRVKSDPDPETGEVFSCVEHGNDCFNMVMVGDDRVWHTDPADVHEIADLDYCRSCGQIGCGMNVYE